MGRSTWVAIAMLALGCGRISFDPIDNSGADGGGAGGGDGGGGDASGGSACPLVGNPSCPVTAASLTMFGMHTSSGRTAANGDGLTGSCGGAGAEEHTVSFLVMSTATYTFTTSGSNFDTVLYLRDANCAGTELACNDNFGAGVTSQITIALTAGQQVIAVVDGANGTCGDFSLGVSGI